VLLDKAACERIHEAGLQVLERVGVRVDDPEVVDKLQEAGARVDGTNVVHIPRRLVEWAIQQAPKTIRVADRTGKLWEMGPQGGTMVLTGNALYINRGRERHDLKAADMAELARVVDACNNIQGMVGTGVSDYPPLSRDFVGFRIMARHTAKHLRPCIYSDKGGRLVVEMAQVLLGSTPLRERPIVSTGFSILSPLHWTAFALGVFKQTAGFGVPATINSEPLAGGTAPVTLAGCLVIGDADVLSGLLINQLLEPGRPCIYNIGFAHVLDMANTIAVTGTPENALLQSAGADLARFHGLPSASWMSTESMTLDSQAAFEKMITGLAHAAAGVNFIWGAGNLESTLAMSPESLVMDDEIAGYFLRYQKGIPVDEETLALPTIEEIGLKGDFLGSDHTLQNYKQVLSRPILATRMLRSKWKARGGRTYEEAIQQRVRDILAAEPRSYLDAHQEAELERIQEAGMRAMAGT
jgi:trimethylamine--corrinoid protein Co-methyltransferase